MHNRIYSFLLLLVFSTGIGTSQALFSVKPKEFSLWHGVGSTVCSPTEWFFFVANSGPNLNDVCGSAGFVGSIIRNSIPPKEYAKLDKVTQTVLEHPYATSNLLNMVFELYKKPKNATLSFLLDALYLWVHYKLKLMDEIKKS